MQSMNKIVFTAALAAATLAGCTMAPKYERPAAPVSTNWSASAIQSSDAKAVAVSELEWRKFYTDPALQRLIQIALDNNRDLRVATLNVEQIRAQYRMERSALLPSVNGSAGGSRQRIPKDLSGTGDPMTTTQYSVSGGVTAYELDLFGRVRSLKAQALERYLASEEAQKSARLSLISAVAIQYLNVKSLEEQLGLVQQTMDSVKSSYELIRHRFELGDASELDLRLVESQVQTARVNLTAFEQRRAQANNALALLLGQSLPQDLASSASMDSKTLLADLQPGLPSETLQRRPDILAAEHQLKAANANIGAARAAFFPKVLLTGSAGTASADLSDLFTGPSATWSFAPQITVPLFTGGRNKASLDASKVSKLIEVAQYEKAIQSAFREVSDALVTRTMVVEQIAAQEALVEAQKKRYQLADLRYRNGVDSYQEALLAQQALFAAQQSLIDTRLIRYSNLINLYKALGGGGFDQPAKKS